PDVGDGDGHRPTLPATIAIMDAVPLPGATGWSKPCGTVTSAGLLLQCDEPQPVFVPEKQLVERARITIKVEGEELLVIYLGPVGHSRTVLTDKGSPGVSGGGEGRAAVGAWRLMRSRHVGAALQ
ncbi:MAG: hypothetical protein EBY47_09370, partial [Actinobacteria bacterium]|nr:hypothetical protein [Actinomycetota bacterium]